MRKDLTFSFFLFLSLFILIFASSCSSFKRFDDAVRIKKDSAYKYENYPFDNSIIRNGYTLRGTVVRLETVLVPDSCPQTASTKYTAKNRVVFLDTISPTPKFVEMIPFEDVDFIGPKFDQPLNAFENFNFPLEPKYFRYVRWDTIVMKCKECNCNPFGLAFTPPEFEFKCAVRKCRWYFLELRGGLATFRDKISETQTIGTNAFFGEVAAGIRFGNRNQYGIGLMLSSGVPIYNQFTSEKKQRPLALLHFRWDPYRNCAKVRPKKPNIKTYDPCESCPDRRPEIYFEDEIPKLKSDKCVSPFIFIQVGMPVDKFSLDLTKVNINTECKDKIKMAAPYLDIDFLPITFTFGAGLDISLTSAFDISIDAGFRRYAFGESQTLLGFTNVPSYRRINMFFIRTGITF